MPANTRKRAYLKNEISSVIDDKFSEFKLDILTIQN